MPPLVILGIGLLIAGAGLHGARLGAGARGLPPAAHAPRLTPLITAIGMSIVLQNLAMIIWGRNYITFPADDQQGEFRVGGASFTNVQIIIVLVAAA
jgi:branched-chain amino acid transport system permease protein